MASVKVISYYANWNFNSRSGGVQLNLADGNGYAVNVNAPEELSMLVDLLRNESPTFLDTSNGWFSTGPEPAGEAE